MHVACMSFISLLFFFFFVPHEAFMTRFQCLYWSFSPVLYLKIYGLTVFIVFMVSASQTSIVAEPWFIIFG